MIVDTAMNQALTPEKNASGPDAQRHGLPEVLVQLCYLTESRSKCLDDSSTVLFGAATRTLVAEPAVLLDLFTEIPTCSFYGHPLETQNMNWKASPYSLTRHAA